MKRHLAIVTFALLSMAASIPEDASAAAINCQPDPNTDEMIEYGDTVSCSIDAIGDTDTFHFLGSTGDNIRPTLAGSDGGRVKLELYAPGGGFINANGGSGNLTANLNEVLTEDGVHTLLVISASTSFPSFNYTLELPCLGSKCVGGIGAVDTLGYTAVDPCRIVDTRYGIGGSMSADETRSFKTYGDVTSQNKLGGGAPGSYPDECPFALGEHVAVHLNVTVVPTGPSGQGGYVTVWPHGETQPASSFINYKAGVQNIANAGTVKTHSSDGATADISVYARRDLELIIDVMGYYTE